MKSDMKQEIILQLDRMISTKQGKDGKPTQNILARQLGVSAATLSQIRTGKGDVFGESMWLSLYNHPMLGLREWDLAPTRNIVTMDKLLRDAQQSSRMVAVSAYTGAGKTTSLRHFASKEANVYYVLCDAVMSRNDLLREIALMMNADMSGRPKDIITAIVDKARKRNKGMLILDDVGKLSDPCIRLIQILYDQTEGIMSLVLAGTDYFKSLIDKKAQKDKMGYRELKSRISIWQKLEEPSYGDIQRICDKNGITDEGEVRNIATGAENFREVKHRIENYLRAKTIKTAALEEQPQANTTNS